MELLNMLKSLLKISAYVAGIGTLSYFLFLYLFSYPMPWKITDPRDSRFDIEKFKLTDYDSKRELYDTLKYIFPKDTSKSYIDNFLMECCNVDISFLQTNECKFTSYKKNIIRTSVIRYLNASPDNVPSYMVLFCYNNEEKLNSIEIVSP